MVGLKRGIIIILNNIIHSQMVPTKGITWLFSCPDIIPNNINPRQERR